MAGCLTDCLNALGELSVTNPQCAQGKGYVVSIDPPDQTKYICKKNYRPTLVERHSEVFQYIENAMQQTIREHRGNRGGSFRSYHIVGIERVGNQSLVDRYRSYKTAEIRGSPNEQMLFHGTPNVNKIIHHGFDKSETNPNGMFGGGFYFTDVSSKANQYIFEGGGCDVHNNTSCYRCERKLLLCRVILGSSLKLSESTRYDTAPDEYNSVTGVAKPGGLRHNEYVVYKSQQIYPEFLIKYKIQQ